MPANVKGHVVATNVSYGPFHLYGFVHKGKLLLKTKFERENGACLRSVVGYVSYRVAFVRFQLKLGVLQKAVLAHFVDYAAMSVLSVPHRTHCRE